ncbi:hypothetical protein EBZ35_03215 [bacterium]|jgi:hypothetical protein|nr:hypothetical protein [bacterium]
MSELLGLIDSIEALVLEGKKVPFSEKVVLDERRVLVLLDKLRIVVKNDPLLIRRAIETTPVQIEMNVEPTAIHPDVLRQADAESHRVRRSADEYADNVLAHLQMVVTRVQKNLIKLEQSIESGRDHLVAQREERPTA